MYSIFLIDISMIIAFTAGLIKLTLQIMALIEADAEQTVISEIIGSLGILIVRFAVKDDRFRSALENTIAKSRIPRVFLSRGKRAVNSAGDRMWIYDDTASYNRHSG